MQLCIQVIGHNNDNSSSTATQLRPT